MQIHVYNNDNFKFTLSFLMFFDELIIYVDFSSRINHIDHHWIFFFSACRMTMANDRGPNAGHGDWVEVLSWEVAIEQREREWLDFLDQGGLKLREVTLSG